MDANVSDGLGLHSGFSVGVDLFEKEDERFSEGKWLGYREGPIVALGLDVTVGRLLGILIGGADRVGDNEGAGSTQGQSSPKEVHSRIGDHIGSLNRSSLQEYLGFPEGGP